MSIWKSLIRRKSSSKRRSSYKRQRGIRLESLEARQLMAADIANAYDVSYTETAPTIDGEFAPSEWSDAAIFENNLTSPDLETETLDKFYMTWDDDNLYVLTVAQHTEWTALSDDSVNEFEDSLVLRFGFGDDSQYEFSISQRAGDASFVDGVLKNLALDLGDWADTFLESGVRIAHSNTSGLGVTEIQIPWSSFADGMKPVVGESWTFGIVRQHDDATYAWTSETDEDPISSHGQISYRHNELVEEALAFDRQVVPLMQALIELSQTSIAGDSNDDGVFDSSDLVMAFQSGSYESGMPATHAEGDWNGDGLFNSSDLVYVLSAPSPQPPAINAEQLGLMKHIVDQSGKAAAAVHAGEFATAANLQLAVRTDFAALSSDLVLATVTGWIPYGEKTKFYDSGGNRVSAGDLDGDSFTAVNEGGTIVTRGPNCELLVLRDATIEDTHTVLIDGKVKPTREVVRDSDGKKRFETDISYDARGRVTGRVTTYYDPDGQIIAERDVTIDPATGRPVRDELTHRGPGGLVKVTAYDPATGVKTSSEVSSNDLATGTKKKVTERKVGGCLVRTEETRDAATGNLTRKRIFSYDPAFPNSAKKIVLISYDNAGNPEREVEGEWDPATGKRTGRRTRVHTTDADGNRTVVETEYKP